MRSFTTAMALSLVFITHTLQAQIVNFPPLEHVYKQLDTQLKNPCRDCTIELAKKQDGYYVIFVPYGDYKYDHVQYSKIWDAATNKYLTVDFSKHVDPKNTNPECFKGIEWIRQKETESDFNYFYGYPDYIKDLISYLEAKSDLKTNELEMLARAYSAAATNYIHPNFSGKIMTETMDLSEPGYEKVSEERIKSFREYADKSIACYEKIKTMNPNYQPLIIKRLDLKMNEDLMDYYLTMKTVKEPEIAQTFFDRIQFTAMEIEAAKTALNNCKNGGILFVSGDNTTYPLLYVQDKFNFRTDVSVINSSLLQTAWYFDYIKQTSKVKTGLSLATYKALNAISILAIRKDRVVDYTTWLADLEKSMKGKQFQPDEYSEVLNQVSLTHKNEKLSITLTSNGLTAATVFVLDILSNNPENPVYVDNPTIFETFGMTEKFALHGTVFEFTGKEVNSFCDSESFPIMQETIKRSKIPFNMKTGPLETWVFESWCFGLNCLSRVDTSGLNRVYTELKSKLDDKIVAKGNDEGMLIQYIHLMENVSPKDLAAFYRMYSPFVTKRLAKISDTELLTKENVQIVSFLQDLYFPKIDPSTGKYTFTQEQKNTLTEIQAKVKTLMANPENQKKLSWTYDELVSVNDRFKDLGM